MRLIVTNEAETEHGRGVALFERGEFLAALAATFIVIIIIVDLLLRALVVKPVAEISEMANKVSMGQLDTPEFVRKSNDEIGSLSQSFNRMRRSLENAMKMLEEQS